VGSRGLKIAESWVLVVTQSTPRRGPREVGTRLRNLGLQARHLVLQDVHLAPENGAVGGLPAGTPVWIPSDAREGISSA